MRLLSRNQKKGTDKIAKLYTGLEIFIMVDGFLYEIVIEDVFVRNDVGDDQVWQTFITYSYTSRKTGVNGKETVLTISFLDTLKQYGVEIGVRVVT